MELKVHELKDAMKFWKQKVPLSLPRRARARSLTLSLSLSLSLSGSPKCYILYIILYIIDYVLFFPLKSLKFTHT